MVYVLLISFLDIKGEGECLVPLLKSFQILGANSKVLLSLYFGCCRERLCKCVLLSGMSVPRQMCARHSLGPGAQALHPGDTAGCHFDEGDRAFVLSMSSRGGLPPEKGLKCGSPCAARKVSDAEGTPEAGGGQLCWRDSCKPQRNGRTRHCLNDPPSSFSWQKEDIQSAGGHGQKASFVVPPPQSLGSTTSTSVPVLSPG